MNEQTLRKQLKIILEGGKAHLKVEDTINNFPVKYINSKVPKIKYSAWDLIEHMRIAQQDIIDFIKNEDYVELQWPDEYWPEKKLEATEKDWFESVKMFLDDLNELMEMIENPGTDLFIPLTHGDEYTILREVLLVADHNSYHIGQLMCLKRALE